MVVFEIPCYTSKPKQGAWANPRARWLKQSGMLVRWMAPYSRKASLYLYGIGLLCSEFTTSSVKTAKQQPLANQWQHEWGLRQRPVDFDSANASQIKSVNACSLATVPSRVGEIRQPSRSAIAW